jgi:alpha-L-rhamnosidase
MSGAWRGDWIGPEESPRSFTRVHFRRTVELDAVPRAAAMRITADSRYVLQVNGVEAGRGPQRSQPWRLFYDEWDIASLLRVGVNVVAVLVTWFGSSNAIWQQPVPSGRLGTGPALLVDGMIGDRPLCSDTSWKTATSQAWSVFPRRLLDGLPAERLDARLLPSDWAAPDFPDGDWAGATLLGA